jgi:hypothetical protein
MFKVAITLITFLGSVASASTPVNEKILNFREFIKAPLPAEIATRMKASSLAMIPIAGRENLPSCSGVIVSNSGYVITDFHCVFNKPRNDKGEITDLSPKSEFRKARVLAQGKGTYLNFPGSQSPGFNFKEFNKNFDDWALLKLPERAGGYACAQVSEDVSDGASVYHMGFPQVLTMANSWLKTMLDPGQNEFKDSTAQQLRQKLADQIREGLARGDDWAVSAAYPLWISLGYSFKTVANAQKRVPILSQQADLDKVIDLDHYSFSTAPIHVGMSGGGVFGIDNGQLLGLNVFTFGNMMYSNAGFPYGVGFIRIDYIKESIRKKLDAKTLREAFDCKPSSNNPTHFLAAD